MTPREKAKQLYDEHKMLFKHHDANPKLNIGLHEYFKKCAIKTVDEIIKSQTCCDDFECRHEGSVILKLWGNVKREIEKL